MCVQETKKKATADSTGKKISSGKLVFFTYKKPIAVMHIY